MRLYTAKEMAEILGLHVDTVRRLGREGKLRRVKVGGSVRFYMPEPERRKRIATGC